MRSEGVWLCGLKSSGRGRLARSRGVVLSLTPTEDESRRARLRHVEVHSEGTVIVERDCFPRVAVVVISGSVSDPEKEASLVSSSSLAEDVSISCWSVTGRSRSRRGGWSSFGSK